jgi:hypothetical protein
MSCITIVIINLAVLPLLCIVGDPCRFNYPSKGVIDLTSLARTDGLAAYQDIIPLVESGYSTFASFCISYLMSIKYRI